MKTCYECRQREKMFNSSMAAYNCEDTYCEFYIPPSLKETKTYAIFSKPEENIKTAQASTTQSRPLEAFGKMAKSQMPCEVKELSISENNIKRNKKFDLEIEIRKNDIEILKFQKILFNLENKKMELKEELKNL